MCDKDVGDRLRPGGCFERANDARVPLWDSHAGAGRRVQDENMLAMASAYPEVGDAFILGDEVSRLNIKLNRRLNARWHVRKLCRIAAITFAPGVAVAGRSIVDYRRQDLRSLTVAQVQVDDFQNNETQLGCLHIP